MRKLLIFSHCLRNISYAYVLTRLFPELVAILGSGWLAQRFQRKGLVIAATSIFPTIGAILMLTVPRSQKGVLLFGYYLVSSHKVVSFRTPLQRLTHPAQGVHPRGHHPDDLQLASIQHRR